MKIYSLNSFVYCTNILVIGVYWAARTTVFYENDSWITQLTPDYKFMFYSVYICRNVSATSYAFGTIMEIYITWSRILVFKPSYKFLLTTTVAIISILNLKQIYCFSNLFLFEVNKVSIFILLVAILLSLPINISREVQTIDFNLNKTNTTLTLYTYSKMKHNIYSN